MTRTASHCVLLGALLLTGGCREEQIASKAVTVPTSWRPVEIGTITFRFPGDRKIDGHDNRCGVRGAPPGDCVLFDEGPVLTHRSGTFTMRTRDEYGSTGPAAGQLGSPVLINGRRVHRSSSEGGASTYVVTADSGGPDSAALLWHQPTDALLWMSCEAPADCLLAEQVAGSVVFKSAADACRQVEADRRLAALKRGSPPPAPSGRCRGR